MIVSGTVVDAAGKPVKGVEVAQQWAASRGAMIAFESEVSDAKGAFRIVLDAEDDPVPLLALDAARKAGQLAWFDPKTGNGAVALQLGPVVRVTGKVTPDFGALPDEHDVRVVCTKRATTPSPSAAISVLLTGGTGFLVKSTDTQPEFSFVLPAGEYDFLVDGPHREEGRLDAQTIDGANPALDVGEVKLIASPTARLLGEPPPALVVGDAHGCAKEVKWEDFHGKWVLLLFWSFTDDDSTRVVLPRLIRLQQRFQSRASEFQILAFHDQYVASFAKLRPQLKELQDRQWGKRELPFPILFDGSGESIGKFVPGEDLSGLTRSKEDSSTPITIRMRRLPAAVLVDPDGKVVAGDEGIDRLESALVSSDKTLAAALAKVEKNVAGAVKTALDPKNEERAQAADLLFTLATSSAKPALAPQLFDGLAKIGGERAVEILTGRIGARSIDSKVRAAAVKALGSVKDLGERAQWDASVERELRRCLRLVALSDADKAVQKAAQVALDARIKQS